jgi:hypothetical protein
MPIKTSTPRWRYEIGVGALALAAATRLTATTVVTGDVLLRDGEDDGDVHEDSFGVLCLN